MSLKTHTNDFREFCINFNMMWIRQIIVLVFLACMFSLFVGCGQKKEAAPHPKESGDNTAVDYTAVTGWKNNKDTAIIPYEEFVSKGAENIIRAVNKSGIGVANTPGFEIKSGKHYQVTFVMTKTSGAYPSFRISEDPYGNTSPLVYNTTDGQMTYKFEVPKSRIYYAVFRVEDKEQTDFSISSFSFKEVKAVKQ